MELEQLRSLVHVDHLTGALNRSGLDQAYTREAARADRQEVPLGTALLDIDDFKVLNDRHGHQAGDAALVHFAQVIRSTIRPSDVVVRFGGEEFLFLLPDSGSDQAARAMRRLQHDLERNPLVYMHRKLPMTFSAGIAVRKPGESRDALILRADRALYKAKVAGKNRAVTAD
jgi:diguanylate cyclase